jgi:phosphoserine phosphatase
MDQVPQLVDGLLEVVVVDLVLESTGTGGWTWGSICRRRKCCSTNRWNMELLRQVVEVVVLVSDSRVLEDNGGSW